MEAGLITLEMEGPIGKVFWYMQRPMLELKGSEVGSLILSLGRTSIRWGSELYRYRGRKHGKSNVILFILNLLFILDKRNFRNCIQSFKFVKWI